MKKELPNLLFEKSLSEYSFDFLECSKLHSYSLIEYGENINSIMQSSFYTNLIKNNTSEMGFCVEIPLPKDNENSSLINSYNEIQTKRESTRKFNKKGITLKKLSSLLQFSYSLKGNKRNIPSAGGLYPIELFYINLNTQGLAKGVFHYNLSKNVLTKLENLNFQEQKSEIQKAFYFSDRNDVEIKSSAGIIILGGILNRVSFKYGDRGIRWALIESGAIMQNIYLSSSVLNLGCCAIGGYLDDNINKLLGFVAPYQTVLNAIVIGAKLEK